MSLLAAVIEVGQIPDGDALQKVKKAYAETLSHKLAVQVAAGMRDVGFPGVKPLPGQPGEKAFQGGLGSKKVDVSYSDEQHGLIFAVSIKSICFPPFGKNLKNRFGDLCTEAIGLHMRFPYSAICMLFVFPESADQDVSPRRAKSTFRRAAKLFTTVSGRKDYTDADEKFEWVALLRFTPMTASGPAPTVTLMDAMTEETLSEEQFFQKLRELHDFRNPHAPLTDDIED